MDAITKQSGLQVSETQGGRVLRSRNTINVSYNHESSPSSQMALSVVGDSYQESQQPGSKKRPASPNDEDYDENYGLSPKTKKRQKRSGAVSVKIPPAPVRAVAKASTAPAERDRVSIVDKVKLSKQDAQKVFKTEHNDFGKGKGKLVRPSNSLAALKAKKGLTNAEETTKEKSVLGDADEGRRTEQTGQSKATIVSMRKEPAQVEVQPAHVQHAPNTTKDRLQRTSKQGKLHAHLPKVADQKEQKHPHPVSRVSKAQEKQNKTSILPIATPPCAQPQTSQPHSSSTASVSPVKRSVKPTARIALDSPVHYKRNTEIVPLVDESKHKKQAVITFGEGHPKVPHHVKDVISKTAASVARQQPRETLATYQQKAHASSETSAIAPPSNEHVHESEAAEYNAEDDHPLAGYAAWLSSGTVKQLANHQLSPDLGVRDGIEGSPYPTHDEIDTLPQVILSDTPEQLGTFEATSQPTESQRGMPPPNPLPKSKPTATKLQLSTKPISRKSLLEVTDDQAILPAENAVEFIDASKFGIAAEKHAINKDGDKEVQAASRIDDSGYQSAMLKATGRVRPARPAERATNLPLKRVFVNVDETGSPRPVAVANQSSIIAVRTKAVPMIDQHPDNPFYDAPLKQDLGATSPKLLRALKTFDHTSPDASQSTETHTSEPRSENVGSRSEEHTLGVP